VLIVLQGGRKSPEFATSVQKGLGEEEADQTLGK